MSSQVVLVYDCEVGVQPNDASSAAFAKVRDLELDPEGATAELLGLTLDTDVTALVASKIRRTLTYAVTATGNANFPSEDALKSATRGLFTSVLELNVPARVTAFEPVVS